MSTTRIKEILQGSDASADRSLVMAEKTKQLGIDISETLQHQGQQLKNAEENVDTILYQQKKAERHLSAIESTSGWFANKLRLHTKKHKSAKDNNKKIKKEKRSSSKSILPTASISKPEPINHDLLDSDDKHLFDHTNDTLEKISGIFHDLKQIAIEQGEEISEHNARLPRLQKKITQAQVTMDSQTHRVRRGY